MTSFRQVGASGAIFPNHAAASGVASAAPASPITGTIAGCRRRRCAALRDLLRDQRVARLDAEPRVIHSQASISSTWATTAFAPIPRAEHEHVSAAVARAEDADAVGVELGPLPDRPAFR